MTAAESNFQGEWRIGVKREQGRAKWFRAIPSPVSLDTAPRRTHLISEIRINNTASSDLLRFIITE